MLQFRKKEMYILGIGSFGAFARYALERTGVKVEGFIDMNPNSEIKDFGGVPVIKNVELPPNAEIVIASNRYNHGWLKEAYKGLGRIQVLDEVLDIEKVSLDGCSQIKEITWSKKKLKDEIRNYIVQQGSLKAMSENKNDFEIKTLDIVVTERCSLKCVDCSNLMQYYQKPMHIKHGDMQESLTKIFDAVKVNCVRLIGGEPLLSPVLGELVNSLFDRYNHRFRAVEIYTNGTIIPSQALIDSCRDRNITFYISDYGDLSRKKQELMECLKRNNIGHTLEDELIWQDSGRVTSRNAEGVHFRYNNCCVNKTFSLIGGSLYSCPFSANFHNIYKDESISERDVIRLSNTSKEELRDRLRSFVVDIDPLSACYYCNGRDFTVPEVAVAVQTRHILNR